jgi:Flp pilus assembly pilin Flp
MKHDSRRSGQTMVEYIIIVVVIAIAALAVFGILGDTVKDKAGGAVTSLTDGKNADAAKTEAGTSSIDKFKGLHADGAE